MSCIAVLKKFRIEPFIFLFFFAFALEGLTITQLAQDKICLQNYGLTDDYCSELSEQVSSDNTFDFKTQILADVTQFTLYKTIINSVPVIFWSMFLGAWADRHANAPKFLMIFASSASIIESIILLLNAIYFEEDAKLMLLSFLPFSLSGGLLSITMSLYSYISSTTEPKFRTIRFAIIESILFIASPLGIFIGGKLIGVRIKGFNGQLRHYILVFIIGLIAQILATVWIVLIPFEKSIYRNKNKRVDGNDNQVIDNSLQTENSDHLFDTTNETEPLIRKKSGSLSEKIKSVDQILNYNLSQQNIIPIVSEIPEPEVTEVISCVVIEEPKDLHWYYMFKDLFDVQNVRDMINTCIKPRSGRKRTEIWILIISLTLVTLTNNGTQGVMFQFVQRMFRWNVETYSIVNASVLLMTSISVVVVVPILIKVFKFNDNSLSIVGVLSVFLQNLIRGTLLNETAFLVSYVFGSFAYVTAISVRSQISSIVEHNEENKVFGLLSTLETFTPFLASIVYSTIFNATLVILPAIVFQLSSAILLIPLIGFVFIALFCE